MVNDWQRSKWNRNDKKVGRKQWKFSLARRNLKEVSAFEEFEKLYRKRRVELEIGLFNFDEGKKFIFWKTQNGVGCWWGKRVEKRRWPARSYQKNAFRLWKRKLIRGIHQ